MLKREGETYVNTPATGLFLDRTKPSYLGGLLEMANARLYPFWGNLATALRTGEPQNEILQGENFFAGLYADPQRLAGFLQAMTGLSMGARSAPRRSSRRSVSRAKSSKRNSKPHAPPAPYHREEGSTLSAW